MPDMEMCNSTVCFALSNCERNWDSLKHEPDRDVKLQKFIPQNELSGIRHVNGKASDCRWYMPVSDDEVVMVRYQTGYGVRTVEFRQAGTFPD
jgi:hypothetical protein